MKRSILVSLVLGSLLLSACGQTKPPATGDVASSASSAVSAASSVQGEARVIRVEASNWAFTPSVITAKVGEKVKLEFVGVSGNHGIGVPDLGLDVKFNEGQTVTADLPTDKAGSFPFKCNVLCGEGHRDMTGTIVVE
ncbi:MAG: cupredoxin domain-containing protein [Candidatus Peribacter sp.]|nr:cupredoxin domain-containing protein [Candidatus Peribacter sp.]